MSKQLIHNSYYGNPNTSNKISEGIVDVNLSDSITLNLNIQDIEILKDVLGLDYIDFNEWRGLCLGYGMSMINKKKSNSRTHLFSYDFIHFSRDPFTEEKEIYIDLRKKSCEDMLEMRNKICSFYDSLQSSYQNEIKGLELQLNRQASLSEIDIIGHRMFFMTDSSMHLMVSNEKMTDLLDAVKEYFNTYYRNTIEYMKKYISKSNKESEFGEIFDINKEKMQQYSVKEGFSQVDLFNMVASFFPDVSEIDISN